ncbi:recombinase family protein [Micromonospora sp. NPDC007271]|uniref:recombinase family protein n=1 Tax=Micromonospora sp. NPDC007271 TaxID=3154587 RepID=UPI00340EA424
MARVLGVVRLSRTREESTSVERQKQYIKTWAEQNGHTLVDFAEDTDVSGAMAPWERPKLGEWLPFEIGGTAQVAEFDILCAWRLDRISRRVLHLAALIDWCKRSGKSIASTSEGFDINSPMGGIFVNILAALAEGELEAIRERARSSFTHLMKQGRWRGGFVPYGYRPVKAATGEGWRLEIDPETSAVVREIVSRIVGGASANSVVRWLNDEKVPSSLDVQRMRAGKAAARSEWRVGNLLKMLRSHTLLGYSEMTETRTVEGKQEKVTRLVLGEDGLPLRRAEPILTHTEWGQLQEALTKNSNPKAGNRVGGSPLLRVAYCKCGEPLYRNRGRAGMYYRCGLRARASRNCPEGMSSIPAHLLEGTVERGFLTLVGDLEIVRRVFVPGENFAERLEQIEQRLKELREDRAAGLYSGDDGTREFREMYRSLEAQRAELKAKPSRPDEWVLEPTGQTYRERWASLDDPSERNRELREAGVRAIVHAQPISTSAALASEAASFRFDLDRGTVEDNRVMIEIPRNLWERVREHVAKAQPRKP